jgi:anti-anti-sigma factor
MAGRSHHFSVDMRSTDTAAMITPHGDVDIATAPQLSEAFEALGGRYPTVTVDLSDVEFMDSAALTALFLFSRAAEREGVELTVTGVHGEVATVMEVTGLDVVLRLDQLH